MGISHFTTPPHTPEQNGTAERRHRHIVETGLSLLHYANLPLTFWSHAFQTAVYLINRLPTSVLNNQTPFQLMHHQSPNYTKLKPFGCLCFPWLRPYSTSKLQPRSTKCVFLGYSPSKSAYKCLDITTNRLYHSRHVKFVPTEFPNQHPPNPSTSLPSLTDFFQPVTPTNIPTNITPIPPSPPHPSFTISPSPPPIQLPLNISVPISTTLPSLKTYHRRPKTPAPFPTHSNRPTQSGQPTSSPNSPPNIVQPTFSSPLPSDSPPPTSTSPQPSSPVLTATPNPPSSSASSPTSTSSTTSNSSPVQLPPRTRKPNPKYFGDKFINTSTLHPLPSTLEPTTHTQALRDPNWRKAMDDEFNALIHNGTWELIPPSNHNPINCKWVFQIKKKPGWLHCKIQGLSCCKRLPPTVWC